MKRICIPAAVVLLSAVWAAASTPQQQVTVTADWKNVLRVSETVATTQHLANAMTVRSHPQNKALLRLLKNLHTDDTRLQLWFSVPRQAVPELKPPTATETYWDFRDVDPVVIDYFANTKGKHHVNIGTIPRWMFQLPPVTVPSDPGASLYEYKDGTRGELLKDQSGELFAAYQARIFQWYTQGGFTDELGRYHRSGYHFKIDYWGILNEPQNENYLSVETYTRYYDAVAKAIHKIDPHVEFLGPESIGGSVLFTYAKYFLNPKNHDPAAPPVKWFTLHNYAVADNDPNTWQAAYFTAPKNRFGATASSLKTLLEQLISVRDQYGSPAKFVIDEYGTFDLPKPDDDAARADEPYSAYNPLYWVASGGNYAAGFIVAERLGISIFSMTQMVGAPTQSESSAMFNWDTMKPNAHYWTLKLILDNFAPGDRLVATDSSSRDVVAQASETAAGRRLLLVNTSNHDVQVNLQGALAARRLRLSVVDAASGENPARTEQIRGSQITLAPFAIAVVGAAGR